MHVHFIAIGGSAMHNLAIALHKKGFTVSGSDDEIVEPSFSRLKSHGLLPGSGGWDPERIHPGLNAVILGMHARSDNPELLKAQELGIPIYSYPEYIYEQSKDKKRVVIGGSHGKTTITAMILHVMKLADKDFDYMVGAQLQGFDTMVKITENAPVIILEGDEYLSSPIDRRPKFHLYKADVGVISGIAWDHINVFPTFENYLEQFDTFIDTIEDGGTLIWFEGDEHLKTLSAKKRSSNLKMIPYRTLTGNIINGITHIETDGRLIPLQVFGEHNLQNLNAAKLVCHELDISESEFFSHIASFKGAARRLELIAKNEVMAVFKDFAHSPSKLKATIQAVKKQFPERQLIACMELHTFSSLNKSFLSEYKDAMHEADQAIVYYNPHTIGHKKLEPLSDSEVKEAFNNPDLRIYTDSGMLLSYLKQLDWPNKNLLLMSSGNFGGLRLEELAADLSGQAV